VVWRTALSPEGQLKEFYFWYFNDAYARVSGLKLDEVRGKSVREVWPETEQSWYDVYGEVARTGIAKSFEMHHGPTRGLYACNAYRPPHLLDRLCVVFEDVTERRQAIDHLRQMTTLQNTILNTVNVGISFIKGRKVQWFNPAFTTTFGYTANELQDMDTSAFYPDPNEFERVGRDGYALLATGVVYSTDIKLQKKDGTPVWCHLTGQAINPQNLDEGTIWALRDISARRQAEDDRSKLQEQLQQAMKMEAVGRLAGGVAHDFNNLLTALSGDLELIKMDLKPDDPLMAYVDDASKAAQSAASLTRQLLAFSRRQMIEPKVLNLNDLVEAMHRMLARVIGEDISLQTRQNKELGAVKVDPGQFEQVLVNLVVNARDAMPNGGKLLLETDNVELDEQYCRVHQEVQPGQYVLLAISDTGHGMDEQVKQRIFEPFFTTKPKGRGTGMGLATLFGAVKQAGGSIEVYSEIGKGTTFKIYLPRVEEQPIKLTKAKSALNIPRGSETVLLVEDEDSVRELARIVLTKLGYTVLPASNASEALLLAEDRSRRIDLLMTDVVMPGMNGRELAEKLLHLRPELKVLFSSGYTENVIAHHGVVDEHVAFIGKPYSVQALAAKIREVLASRTTPIP
jgi:PAS domain S-box-containing protein